MENIKIRWLKPDDCLSLKNFINKLNDAEGLGSHTKLTADDLRRDAFSDHPLFYCLIVEENDEIRGYCMFCSIYDSDYGKKIYIEDIYVENNLRNKKIGSALMQVLIEYGKKNGYSKMALISLGSNENFYTKIGFTNDTKRLGYEWYCMDISGDNQKCQNLSNNIRFDL